MLKSKSFFPHDKPVYREILPQALRFSWKHPHLWVFGIFAALLNTGGALDVFWKFFNSVQSQGTDIFIGNTAVRLWEAAQATAGSVHAWLPFARGLLAVSLLTVLFMAFSALSCICQGALVHAIGVWKSNKKNTFKQALWVGARALFPIAVLNILILTTIWIARFGVSLPLAMALGRDHSAFTAVYVVSFIVFFVLALVMAIIQVYALNAMILQGASLAQAFSRAWELFKSHWLVTIETAVIQSVMVLLIGLAATIATTILSLPSLLLYVLSLMNNNFLLFQVALGTFMAITLLFLLAVLGFTVSFQYAVWTLMFRKLGEGGVVPKMHRLFRNLFDKSTVPQS